MNRNKLTTSVNAVPNSVHQRMYSSLPLGKKSSTSANTLGKKMHRDIKIRSNSTMETLALIVTHFLGNPKGSSAAAGSPWGLYVTRPSPLVARPSPRPSERSAEQRPQHDPDARCRQR